MEAAPPSPQLLFPPLLSHSFAMDLQILIPIIVLLSDLVPILIPVLVLLFSILIPIPQFLNPTREHEALRASSLMVEGKRIEVGLVIHTELVTEWEWRRVHQRWRSLLLLHFYLQFR